ncbi:MAG: DVU_1555 family C-GCAxxG-C-C protein [Desulfoplanes sp.]
MNDTAMRMLPLAGQGFCCSQILVLLALELQGKTNPELVRSVGGLCHGLGKTGHICGALLGGCCVLSLYTNRGEPGEEKHPQTETMVHQLSTWFEEFSSTFGGSTCGNILGKTGGEPDMGICGDLVSATFDKAMEILANHGIDPTIGKDE